MIKDIMMNSLVCPVCGQPVEYNPVCTVCGYPWGFFENNSEQPVSICHSIWIHGLMEQNMGNLQTFIDIEKFEDDDFIDPVLIVMPSIYLMGEPFEVPVFVRNAKKVHFEIKDSNIVDCAWGAWNKNRIPLTITPGQTGVTEIKIYVDDNPEKYRTIKTYNLYECDAFFENGLEKLEDEIQFADFVVKTHIFRCDETHDIKELTAVVNVLASDGKIISVSIDAGYCSTCNCYFILLSDYEKLRQRGVPLCRVVDEKEFITKWHLIKQGVNFKDESILHQCGYSVNQTDNLSDVQRHEILRLVIEEGFYTVSKLKSFLGWLIDRAKRTRNRNMWTAIEKWESDLDWISSNLSKSQKTVGIQSLTKKTYIDEDDGLPF